MTADRPGGWLRRQIDFLGSGRLAVALLTALALLLTVYLWVPQLDPNATLPEGVESESGIAGRLVGALQLDDVQHSWLLYATYGLLFVNLLLCMIRRYRAAATQCRFPQHPPPVSSLWLEREGGRDPIGTDAIAECLRRNGYRTLVSDQTVYGLRGRFAVIGHWVFHTSLLFLVVAGVLVAVAPEPFRATVAVGEREPFDLHTAPLMASNLAPEAELPADLPPLRLEIERIEVATQDAEVRQLEAVFSGPEAVRASVGINRPYRSGAYQALVRGMGYMPGWVIVDEQGRMRQGAWVKLAPFPLETEDSFPLGPHGSVAHVRLLPDYDAKARRNVAGSHELRDPRFRLRLESNGEILYEGLLAPDERVQLRPRREFFFLPEIRRYLLLDVLEEKGHEAVFLALGVMIAGLFLRYGRLRKEILVELGGPSVRIFGRSEILEHLFEEELERLADELGSAARRAEAKGGAA
jgi:hypothetical protein